MLRDVKANLASRWQRCRPLSEKIIGAVYRARRKLATAGVVLLALAVGWHVAFGANGMVVYLHKRAEYRQLQSQIDALEKQNQELEQRVQKLRSDPETIEREAREQLGYARPGEEIYTLPAPKPAAKPNAVQSAGGPQKSAR